MDSRIENWVTSYSALAEQVIAKHVGEMEQEFPDEYYPVRPPYRRAVYNHLLAIVDELQHKMADLLEESPDETDQELQDRLIALQDEYEREFALRVRKDPSTEREGA